MAAVPCGIDGQRCLGPGPAISTHLSVARRLMSLSTPPQATHVIGSGAMVDDAFIIPDATSHTSMRLSNVSPTLQQPPVSTHQLMIV